MKKVKSSRKNTSFGSKKVENWSTLKWVKKPQNATGGPKRGFGGVHDKRVWSAKIPQISLKKRPKLHKKKFP